MDKNEYLALPYKIMWHADFSDWRDNKKVHLTAYVREVPSVRAEADNHDEALNILRAKFDSWLENALLEGVDIPVPLDSDEPVD